MSADFAQVRANGIIDLETAKNGLDMLAIDELGLDAVDRNMLTAMIVKFGGRPVGLDTIAAATPAKMLPRLKMFTNRIC